MATWMDAPDATHVRNFDRRFLPVVLLCCLGALFAMAYLGGFIAQVADPRDFRSPGVAFLLDWDLWTPALVVFSLASWGAVVCGLPVAFFLDAKGRLPLVTTLWALVWVGIGLGFVAASVFVLYASVAVSRLIG